MSNKACATLCICFYNRLEIGTRVTEVLIKPIGILVGDRVSNKHVRPLYGYLL